jgi:hypothetical protein
LVSLSGLSSLVILSQLWLPTVQLVLQADWHVLLHSPQAVTFLSTGFAIVLIILKNSPYSVLLHIYYKRYLPKKQAFFIVCCKFTAV